MTATRFLVDRKNIRWPFARLEGEEHHHLSRVLRAKPGRRVWLVDDAGHSFEAEISEVREGETLLRIIGREPAEETRVLITLGQALLKAKRMDWVVLKATELGADVIVPLVTERSVVKVGPGEGRKLERWRKIAREASKQSRRASLPEVREPQELRDFLGDEASSRKLMLTQDDGRLLRDILSGGPGDAGGAGRPAVSLAVGPEGGWSKQEEEVSLASGFEPVSLGKQPLRSETAALAALAMLSHFWKN